MVVPLLLGFAPAAPKMFGSFTGALFGNPLPVLAVFYVCVGATVSVGATPHVVKKGGVLLATKVACGLACAVVLGRVIGHGVVHGGFFRGLSVLAVVAAVNDTNSGLYTALTGQFGRTRDAARPTRSCRWSPGRSSPCSRSARLEPLAAPADLASRKQAPPRIC